MPGFFSLGAFTGTPRTCLFCLGTGCDQCKEQSKKERAKQMAAFRHRLKAIDSCKVCGRIGGDIHTKRCERCPADPVGARPCVRCAERTAKTSFSLCRKCHDELDSKARGVFARRPNNPAPPGHDCDLDLYPLMSKVDDSLAFVILHYLVMALNGDECLIDEFAAYEPAKPAKAACPYDPGSPEKIAELGRRADAREELHHANDAGVDPETLLALHWTFIARVGKVHGVWLGRPELGKVRAPHGVEKVDTGRTVRYRARPWRKYARFDLGHYTDERKAYAAVAAFRQLCEEMPPSEAAAFIRRARRKAS